jgi:hypothetical protein
MKTNATFRLSKQAKRFLALMPFKDQEQRHGLRHMMIEAQVIGNTIIKSAKERNNTKGE